MDLDEINKKISGIAIQLLNERNFDFEKARINKNQLHIEDGVLKIRGYKKRYKFGIHFLSEMDRDLYDILSVLPPSFATALSQIKEKVEKYKSMNSGYERYGSKKEIIKKKVGKSFDIVCWYKREIEKHEIEHIIGNCNSYGGDVGVNYDEEQLLYYDEVYQTVLDVIKRLRNMSDKAKMKRDGQMDRIRKMLEEDFMAVMTAGEL